MSRLSGWWPSVVMFAVASGACSDLDPTGTGSIDLSVVASTSDTKWGDVFVGERAFFEIAEAEPAFAGFFVEDNQLVGLVTDPSRSDAVEQELRARRADIRSARTSEGVDRGIAIRTVPYSFVQLNDWRALALNSLTREHDITSLDIDERRNLLVVGVANNETISAVVSHLSEQGIPLDVLRVGQRPVGRPAQVVGNLQFRTRPIIGGLRVSLGHDEDSWCTLGFSAEINGGQYVSTASHCTPTLFDPLPVGQFYQRAVNVQADFIGTENLDPERWQSRCERIEGHRRNRRSQFRQRQRLALRRARPCT